MKMKLPDKIGMERGQLRILLSSFAAISGVGLLSYAALPLMFASTMESLGLNGAGTGLLYSLEFLAAALSSLIVAPKMGKIKRRDLAFAGAFIVIIGNLASALWSSHEFLLVFRPFTGIGAGLTLACGNATIANARHPAKIAGMMNVLFAGMMFLLMLLLSFVSESWGLQGIYFALAAVTISFLIMLVRMPQRSISNDLPTTSGKTTSKIMLSVAGITIFVVFLLFTLRDSMAWSYGVTIGNEVGYTTSEMGRLLSLQALIGLFGPIIAALIGFKYGMRFPLIFGLIFAGLTSYAIFLSVEAPYLFRISLLVWTAGYFFGISYLTAFAATLDPDGRIVAASGSAMVLGVAAGPAFSGYIISYGGYAMAAWATLALVSVMTIVALVSLKWALKLKKSGRDDAELETIYDK
jgi:predicted MFS family arabinose efflux permease